MPHHISLFRDNEFLTAYDPIRLDLEKRQFSTLIDAVERSLAQYCGMTDAEIELESPICLLGGTLPPSYTFEVNKPDARQIADWIFAAMDSFLSPPISFYHFSSLNPILKSIGWLDEPIEHLLFGRPMFKLVRPDAAGPVPAIVENSDPFWYWLSFWGARVGWLVQTDIQYLLEELERDTERILNFDIARLDIPGIDLTEPVVCESFKEGTQKRVGFLAKRYADALNQQRGLLHCHLLVN